MPSVLPNANRIVLVDPILQALREQRALGAILPLNEALHPDLPQMARESYSANHIKRSAHQGECDFLQRSGTVHNPADRAAGSR
jgi:hypothetical protein